jgi:DNA-binding CsgD family transcriptional regulator
LRLLAREGELEAFGHAVQDVRDGGSRTLVVVGEAGIGKSALLGELRARAEEAGLRVLDGRGAEQERDVPFALAVDALDDQIAALHPRRRAELAPEVEAVLPSAGGTAAAPRDPSERFRFHRALGGLIEELGRDGPVALVLDDLHWADDASLELVLHLLRRPPRIPLLLAVALRGIDPAPRLLDAARGAPGFTELRPRPLPQEDALALLPGDLPQELRDRMTGEAQGNPLFLHELARIGAAAAEGLPPTLQAAVSREVAGLDSEARDLLAGAAVAGDPFDPDVAAAAAGVDPARALELLDGLVAADLVRPAEASRAFGFRHPLVRRAVYDDAPAGWRIAAHERAAATLSAHGASPAERAHHVQRYARPGDDDAVALLEAAARDAEDTAPATAARYYEAALRLLPYGADLRRAELLEPLSAALLAAGRTDDAIAMLGETLALLPVDHPRRADVEFQAATLHIFLDRQPLAREHFLHALELKGGRDAEVEVALALSAVWSYELDEARRWIAAVDADARAADPLLDASVEAVKGHAALWEQRPPGALARGLAERIEAMPDAEIASRLEPLMIVGLFCNEAEQYREAALVLERGLATARASGKTHIYQPLGSLAAHNRTLLLELGEARELALSAEERARLTGLANQIGQALGAVAVAEDVAGNAGEAARAAAEGAEILGAINNPRARVPLSYLQPILHGADPERLVHVLGVDFADLLARGDRTRLARPLVAAAIASGRLDEAERWVDRMAAYAERMALPVSTVRALSARAELLLARGDAEAAQQPALIAVSIGEGLDAGYDTAIARLVTGQVLMALGRRDEAVAALERVAADASRGEALKLRDAAAPELRRHGVRISARARHAAGSAANTDTLTQRERDIADLVAQGQSNKQVAAALFLSEKTIEHNLSRIYAKLGVRSRHELTRLLAG